MKTGRWSFKGLESELEKRDELRSLIEKAPFMSSKGKDDWFGVERALLYYGGDDTDREENTPYMEEDEKIRIYNSYLSYALDTAGKLKRIFDEKRVRIVGKNLIPYGYYPSN